jgi:single-strand DNA-binding protein
MASYNKVLLMGNLTRDPQMKFLPSQMAVTEVGLACSRKFKTASGEDREEVLFVDLTAFGKTGELINQYFTKGKPIFIEGRLKYDQWEDKNGGGKRSKVTVVVDNFQFIGGRDGPGGGGGYDSGGAQGGGGEYDQRPPARSAPPQRAPAQRPPVSRPAPVQQPPAEQPFSDEGQSSFEDGDIPF